MSGSGRPAPRENGRLRGVIRMEAGDPRLFIAGRAVEPDVPIQNPPRYRDKGQQRLDAREVAMEIRPTERSAR